jgi:hypothetical protein
VNFSLVTLSEVFSTYHTDKGIHFIRFSASSLDIHINLGEVFGRYTFLAHLVNAS